MRRHITLVLVIMVLGAFRSTATAQPLGTFPWQLAPFCNVVTVSVTQIGGTFTLDGFDDQCGAATRASVIGTAFPNPDGTIGIGLSLVLTPGGAPVHVDVALNLATLGGPWRDSAGNTGTFVLNPSLPAAGSPRPTTSGLGSASIDPTQVQRRVLGTCSVGQAVRVVNEDGSVACEPIPAAAGGDITAVTAGAGLVGGGTTGAVALGVAFGGSGVATSVARGDHTHAVVGTDNTGVGPGVLTAFTGDGSGNTGVGTRALGAATRPLHNSAFGVDALGSLTEGAQNTAVGAFSLAKNLGHGNTAVGVAALQQNVVGNQSVAVGHSALLKATTDLNTAIGAQALSNLVTGTGNTALGMRAGSQLTTGSNNLYIGNEGVSENNTIRIGSGEFGHSRTFIAGINGVNVSGAAVLVSTGGQLGINTSSAQFKELVEPLGQSTTDHVRRLRPVSFHYKPGVDDGSNEVQYGLIAEEVVEVMPELVVRDEDGRPFTVKYHVLPTLLLAEIQRLERERALQADELKTLREQVDALLRERR